MTGQPQNTPEIRKNKGGRPRLFVPEQYRKKYPYWRKMHGAKMAREMAGISQ